MIVDSHHHLWDPATRDYPWMADAQLAPLRRRFDLDVLCAVLEPLGVSATIAVQAVGTADATVDLLAQADASGGLVAGVVGWVDLTRPDAGEQIAALRDEPGGQRLVGIRHQVHDEPDPGWLARPDVLRGLAAVADAGLRYDLLLRPREIPAALRVAERIPHLPLVVDHGAKPEIATGGWEPWSSGLAALAAHEQVMCKLSGLVTEARWEAWRDDGIERYIARLLELFGPGRLMFGSDWPVCTLAASYQEVLELARSGVGHLTEGERDAVFAGNAAAFYGVAGAAPSALSSHASTPAT